MQALLVTGLMYPIAALWQDAGLPATSLRRLDVPGAEPALASSFALGTAAQASLAVAALAAAEIGAVRNGVRQRVSVDMRQAALECLGHYTVDGTSPPRWDPLAGLYPCADGRWLRLHTNFTHHRDGVLRLLGLSTGATTTRAAVAAALRSHDAFGFEQAATDAGLVVAAVRSFDEWDAHAQAAAVAQRPLVEIERIGDAAPLDWPPLATEAPPLRGLRVLELTRILAGPVAGRTLAAHGADVLLVNSPHLPNIDAIADTSRGKLSALADLRTDAGHGDLQGVLRDAYVFVQSYRPGALDALGFGAPAIASVRPGIVCVSLNAYGIGGPWAERRGFDSLVQAATGFNDAEAAAAGSATPQALPAQLLDMASGFLMAFGALAALHRQRVEGGSWHVRVSLARTGLWLRGLGRLDDGFSAAAPDFTGLMESTPSGFGQLEAMRHAAALSRTPAGWARPSMPPGSHPLAWPGP